MPLENKFGDNERTIAVFDRMDSRLFVTDEGVKLRFTEHYTWSVIGSLDEFQADEDTEHPIDANGNPLKGAFAKYFME